MPNMQTTIPYMEDKLRHAVQLGTNCARGPKCFTINLVPNMTIPVTTDQNVKMLSSWSKCRVVKNPRRVIHCKQSLLSEIKGKISPHGSVCGNEFRKVRWSQKIRWQRKWWRFTVTRRAWVIRQPLFPLWKDSRQLTASKLSPRLLQVPGDLKIQNLSSIIN